MQLRKMTMQDADKMLEWKNYPETRQYAIVTHDEIKKEDHYKWLEQNLQYFQVIGDQMGAVRIQDGEISVWIDREHWSKGIAAYVLEQVCEIGMTARIVAGNVASMRAFIRAGFEPVSYYENYYIFKR